MENDIREKFKKLNDGQGVLLILIIILMLIQCPNWFNYSNISDIERKVNYIETKIDSLLILNENKQGENGMRDKLKEIVEMIQVPDDDDYQDIDSVALLGYAKVRLGLDWKNEYEMTKQLIRIYLNNPYSKFNNYIYQIWCCIEFLQLTGKLAEVNCLVDKLNMLDNYDGLDSTAALIFLKSNKYRKAERLINTLRKQDGLDNFKRLNYFWQALTIYHLKQVELYGIKTDDIYLPLIDQLLFENNNEDCKIENGCYWIYKEQFLVPIMTLVVQGFEDYFELYKNGVHLNLEYLDCEDFRIQGLAAWALMKVVENESDIDNFVDYSVDYYIKKLNFPNVAKLFEQNQFKSHIKLGFIAQEGTDHFALPILKYINNLENIEVKVCYDYLDQDRINEICDWADTVWVEWAHWAAREVLKYKRNCKILVRFHRYELKYIYTLNWNNVDHVWFVNRDVMEDFLRRFGEVNFNMFYLPNVVDVNEIEFDMHRKGKNLIAYSPDMRPIKDYMYALKLLKRLNEIDSGFHLTIKASAKNWDYYYQNYIDYIEEHNLSVTIIPDPVELSDIPNKDIANTVLQGKNFILSVSKYECFHAALAEGLASGCIGIVRDRGGYPDDFWQPYLCDDFDDMVERIIKFTKIKNKDRQKIAKENRDYVQQNFSPEVISNGLLNYLFPAEPRVGIVIPTYNHAHFLKEALDSLLDGSYQNIFILVIDDGSTDNTMELLKDYRDRIYYFRNEHIGSHPNRDIGLKIMQKLGVDYLSFPCADDLYYKHYIQAMVKDAQEKEALVVYPRFSYYDQAKKKVVGNLPFYPHDKNVLLKERCYICDHCLVSKEVFDLLGWQLNWQDYGAYCFFDLWVRLTENPEWDRRIIGLDRILWKYRRYDESLSVTKSDGRPADLKQRVLDSHYRRINNKINIPPVPPSKGGIEWQEYEVGGSRHKSVLIHQDWKVIEIGGGINPCPRANVITNFESELNQRGKVPKKVDGAEMVICDVQDMRRFGDKEFDYLICCHVLEHVNDPIKACGEIQRIAKAGYIECPSYIAELLLGHDCHKWVVSSPQSSVGSQQSGKLVFRRKLPEEEQRFGDFFKDLFYKDNPIRKQFVDNWFQYWEFGYVCFEWQGGFEVEVIG